MVILGIDFGTTSSCISYYDTISYSVKVLANPEGMFTTPSSIYLSPNNDEILIGQPAEDMMMTGNVITNVKRLLGVTWEEYNSVQTGLKSFFEHKGLTIVQDLNNKPFLAIEVMYNNKLQQFGIVWFVNLFLKYLLDFAVTDKNNPVKAIITVPAYYTNTQRQIMTDILTSIRVDVLKVLNEPTAAALAYICLKENTSESTSKSETETVMVVDCGGGTIDISVVEVHQDEPKNFFCEIVQVVGDNYLGGEDFTQKLLEYILKKYDIRNINTRKQASLKQACEHIKLQLSKEFRCNYYLEFLNKCVTVSIEEFNSCTIDYRNKFESMVREAVFGNVFNIKKIVLVGGASRTPFIKTVCQKVFRNQDNLIFYDTIDPKQTISIGASYQAQSFIQDINEQIDLTIIDVLNMSLGVETENGLMSVIVSKNTKLPVLKQHFFSNSQDYVSQIEINIYQGERRFVKDNKHLGTLFLNGLDNTLKRGCMKIVVEFNIDSNGIIHVSAKDYNKEIMVSTILQSKHGNILQTNLDNFDNILNDSVQEKKIRMKQALENTMYRCKQMSLDCHVDLDVLFNKISSILDNYANYSVDELSQIKIDFEDEWHRLMLNLSK